MSRLNGRAKAMAKIKIQEILLNLEFDIQENTERDIASNAARVLEKDFPTPSVSFASPPPNLTPNNTVNNQE